MQSEPSEVTQKTLHTHSALATNNRRQHGFTIQTDRAQDRSTHEARRGEPSASAVDETVNVSTIGSSVDAAVDLAVDTSIETMRPSLDRLNSTSTSSSTSSVDRIIEYENAFIEAIRRNNEGSTFVVVPGGNNGSFGNISIVDFPNGR